MTRTIAIALLSLRTAIRSRLVVWLATALLLTVVGLGLTAKGDGTLDGQVRVLLYYTLGLAAILLGTATLWMACGGIAEEIKGKHIQLVAVKPVHRSQIWLGKWLALVLLNAAMLTLAGLGAYAVLQYKVRSPGVAPEDRRRVQDGVLTASRSIGPRQEMVNEEVQRRVDLLIKDHDISARVSRREIFSYVKKRVLGERSTVPPGASKQWVFDVPANLPRAGSRADSPCSLRIRLYPASRDMKPARGTWTVGWEGNPAAFTHTMEEPWENIHRFALPLSALRPGQRAVVRFTNAADKETSTVVLDPGRNVELLVREGSFGMNLARALVVLLCQLALLAALGLAASTVFSFPVATFMTVSVLAVSSVAHYLAATVTFDPHEYEHSGAPSLYYVITERIMERLDALTGPATRLDPLDPLSDGALVSWGFTGRAVLTLAILYPAALFLLGTYCLKRRELALPE